MIEIVRNMFRRRMRTSLTVFGIVIGVFALTVMGAMSEYFRVLLDNAEKLAASNIGVSPINRDVENRLTPTTMQRLKRIEGVKIVIPTVSDLLGEAEVITWGVPEMVHGVQPEHILLLLPAVSLEKGRWLEKGDRYHAVIGSDIAKKKNLDIGKTIEWREKAFTVVGILEATKTAPDQFVYIPIETARRVMELPSTVIGGLEVIPEDDSQVEHLAARINEEMLKVKAKSPQEAINEIRQALASFQVIMLSGAILAAVVGGLSVMNTMIMSVHERTREIGIKKAIGATVGDIIREYVTEAALIGVAGGVVGICLGWLATIVLNKAVALSLGSTELWMVTGRLLIVALVFATGLGAGAGLYPAWRGASIEPVEALRSE